MELSPGSNTYIWPTPYFFTHSAPDPDGSPLPSLNTDLRTIFRLRMHCQFRLLKYRVAMLYLRQDIVERVHIIAEDLIINEDDNRELSDILIEITDIIEEITGYSSYTKLPLDKQKLIRPVVPKILKYNYVPMFKISQLPKWLSLFCIRQFPYIYIIEDTVYLDLDNISNVRNYTSIYQDRVDRFYEMLQYIEDKRIICIGINSDVNNINLRFVRDWELSSLPPELVDKYKDIIGPLNGLFLPDFEETPEFWKNRLLNKPYYFFIGKSPVVAHSVALKYPNIWVIDGWIELSMNNKNDYRVVRDIRRIIINCSGSVYPIELTNEESYNNLQRKAKSYSPLSISSYYINEKKTKILSLLFSVNGIPPEIDL